MDVLSFGLARLSPFASILSLAVHGIHSVGSENSSQQRTTAVIADARSRT
jgi:hypothetical protein